jgi:hypothetical protein
MPRNGQRREKEIERFLALDSNGNEYIIVIYRTYEWVVTFGKPGEWVGLSKRIACNGKPVNYIDEDTYKILDRPDNIIVKRKVR